MCDIVFRLKSSQTSSRHIYIYICMNTNTQTYKHTHTHTHIYIYRHIYIYIHAFINIYIYIYIYMHTHTYIYIYIYAFFIKQYRHLLSIHFGLYHLSCHIDFMVSSRNLLMKLHLLIGTQEFSVGSWPIIKGVYLTKAM